MPDQLRIPRALFADMVAHAQAELPNECCGVCAGDPATGSLAQVYCLVNEASSPRRYSAGAQGLFQAFRDMRARATELLAIYHSHPTTDAVPSRTDREQNLYGREVVHLIISLESGEPVARAWRLGENDYQEVPWECAD